MIAFIMVLYWSVPRVMGVLVGRMTRKRSERMPFFGLRWFLVVAMRPR